MLNKPGTSSTSRPPIHQLGTDCSIAFLGAAGTVTGSKYLIRVGEYSALVDYGLFQGLKQLRLRNREPFAVEPSSIDAVILTHAHLDHTGYLPVLVRDGFTGPVFCTPPTQDLTAILLRDSGHLQEEEAEHAARHGYSRHSPPLPLYTEQDAERSLQALQSVEFDRDFLRAPGISFRYQRAGHMLGAASVLLTTPTNTILFSGDLGRGGDPLLPDPDPACACDTLVVESTYGNRRHDSADPVEQLAEIIGRTAQRGGVVIIPAFAVGRAQALMYYLHELRTAGRIPDIPIYVDSPMAARATETYRAHSGELRVRGSHLLEVLATARPVASPKESKRVDRMDLPRIIISASGMITGGRVLHHIEALGGNPKNTILLSGYQASGTRGAALLAGERELKMHGGYVPVRAEVCSIGSLSAHADYEEILSWLAGIQQPPKQVFVTHGEPAAADALRRRIEERFGWRCVVPEHREVASLAPAG